jgi:hypothetical protein
MCNPSATQTGSKHRILRKLGPGLGYPSLVKPVQPQNSNGIFANGYCCKPTPVAEHLPLSLWRTDVGSRFFAVLVTTKSRCIHVQNCGHEVVLSELAFKWGCLRCLEWIKTFLIR